jgi:hypothetical protein
MGWQQKAVHVNNLFRGIGIKSLEESRQQAVCVLRRET